MLPTLHDYQIKCKNFIQTHPYCALFLDMGLGKTLITLMALYELGINGYLSGHILVIAPKNVARSTWLDEIQKWQIPVRTKSLIIREDGSQKDLSKKERMALYQDIPFQPPTMYFINREKVKDLVENTPMWYFPTVIIDEVQSFKSHKAERFKSLQQVRPYISRIIELSGTPAPNGLMDLWSEIWLLDMGQRLGPNITTYRRTWFYESRWSSDNHPIDWEPLQGADVDIYRRIADIAISMKNNMLQLPPVTYNEVYVHMTTAEKQEYKDLMQKKIISVTDDNGDNYKIVAKNAAILKAKLSQLASGTIYLDEDNGQPVPPPQQTIFTPGIMPQTQQKSIPAYDENGNRRYKVLHQHKLEYAEYIINNTNSPVLMAYRFKSEKTEIVNYFKNLETKTNDKRYHLEVFDGSPDMVHRWNRQEIPIMLIQPASASQGLNLQDGGHTLIWYTLTWSLEEFLQTNTRLNRQGQKYPVVIHILMTKGTVDKGNLDVLYGKEKEEDALLAAVKLQ